MAKTKSKPKKIKVVSPTGQVTEYTFKKKDTFKHGGKTVTVYGEVGRKQLKRKLKKQGLIVRRHCSRCKKTREHNKIKGNWGVYYYECRSCGKYTGR